MPKPHRASTERAEQPRLAWAYCRVSTTKHEQELSLDEQVRWAEQYAEANHLSLRVFSEKASAKTIVQRSVCVEMLRDLRALPNAKRPHVLVATSFDRLARDIFDAFTLFGDLRDAGVQLYIRDAGQMQMQSPADAAILFGRAFGGHAENDARSARIRASWERRRREGKPTSNKVPYGIQLRNERDEMEPEAARWVRYAFEWYSEGIGMPTIAVRMLEAPPSRTISTKVGPDGKPIVRERQPVWEANRVRKLLEQKRYRGLIVRVELFDQVQERLHTKPRWPQKRRFEYPLSGAIKCAKCGRSYHGHSTGGSIKKRLASGAVRVYSPQRRTRYYGCTVCRYMLNAERLEAEFFSILRDLRVDPGLLQMWVSRERPSGPSHAELEQEAAKLRRLASPERIDFLKRTAWSISISSNDAHVTADLPRQLARISEDDGANRARLREIETALAEGSKRARSLSLAASLIEQFEALYEAATYNERRDLCLSISTALGGLTASPAGLNWDVREARVTRRQSTGTRPTMVGWKRFGV